MSVVALIPRDFIPGYLRSARGVFQTLLSNSGGSFQHRVAEESEIILSGFSVPLWLYPRTSSQDTHATVAEGDTPSTDDPHRLSSAKRATVGDRGKRGASKAPSPKVTHRPRTTVTDCLPQSGKLSEEGVAAAPPPDFARGRAQKKESTSMRLTPESGGYLLSRNSVPSAIASLTSLFGMGRGGTSLP